MGRTFLCIDLKSFYASVECVERGLDKALARKEREMGLVGKRELAEDAAEELNRVLLSLKEGDPVKICYYDEGEYLTVTGSIGFPGGGKQEIIVGDNTINICDIASAERL